MTEKYQRHEVEENPDQILQEIGFLMRLIDEGTHSLEEYGIEYDEPNNLRIVKDIQQDPKPVNIRARLNDKGYGAYADLVVNIVPGESSSNTEKIEVVCFGGENEDGKFKWFGEGLQSIFKNQETISRFEQLMSALKAIEESKHPDPTDNSPDAIFKRRELRDHTAATTKTTRDLDKTVAQAAEGESPYLIKREESPVEPEKQSGRGGLLKRIVGFFKGSKSS